MRRGMRPICSRHRTAATPRFTSGTIFRSGLGVPKRNTRRSCASRPRATSKSIMPFARPRVAKPAARPAFSISQPENGVIEIGSIWFGLTLRRTRGATEALYLMLRHAMDDLGYRRMQWRCNALNAASRAAARRLGFRFEGIFYNHMSFKGRNRDTAWYSILDDEWPQVRALLEQWLSPSNFDQEGTARTSLAALMGQRGPSRRGDDAP